MLLQEIMSSRRGIDQIAEFMDNWQWGRYHLDDRSKQVPPAIFSIIRRFVPAAIYKGTVYRATSFTTKQLMAAQNVQALIKEIKIFRHANKSQNFAWSKTPDGVLAWLEYMGDDAEEMEPGDEQITLFVSQTTTQGIDVKALEEVLVLYGKLKQISRASYVEEVLAPIEPPIHPLEFRVLAPGPATYLDDEGYDTTREKASNTYNFDKISTFHVGEFEKMKTFIRNITKHGKNPSRYNTRHPQFSQE